ncbi:MAG TPA: thioesterase family protein [Nocardioidaceae bacterium]|nr:thioesterase family protein [Nocardioidaceae bacterium]
MSRHHYELHVRFSDVDIYRHVNNVKYFEYYQEARLAFLGSWGRLDGGVGSDFSVVVARIGVEYRRPILFRPEPYDVETWVTRVGTSSYTLGSEIKDGDTVLSSAEVVAVRYDRERQRPRPLTEEERGLLRTVAE